jgi:hypothetical protein
MGLISLVRKTLAPIIQNEWYNDFLDALADDLVGRNTSGVPTAGKNLGNSLYPWGRLFVDGIVLDGSLLSTEDQDSSPYKILSGKARSGSNQPQFLLPSGSGATATLEAAGTNLVLEIDGESVTFDSDVAISGLTVAPSSNNTALVNEPTAADQAATRLWGENNPRFTDHPTLAIDNAGSEVTALVGQYVCFKLDNGSATEYLLGFLKSSTELIDVRRGYFTDSSGNPKNRIVFTDNDTLTLMKLAWVFAKSDETVDISYKNPSVSASEPAAPATNDYWYDLANQLWKQYDGAAWQTVERLPVGLLVIDSTNCVAARSFDFFATIRADNTLELEYLSASTVRAKSGNGVVGVMGQRFRFAFSRPTWDMASHLAAAADLYSSTEQASRMYCFYLTDEGALKISDIQPYWRAEFGGWYHPHLPWRYLGDGYNNASSNLESDSIATAFRTSVLRKLSDSSGNYSTVQQSFQDVTNLEKSIRTTGGLVVIRLQHGADGTAVFGVISTDTTTSSITARVEILRDGASITGGNGMVVASQEGSNAAGAARNINIPASAVEITDQPEPGFHTYKIQLRADSANLLASLSRVKLEIYEIPLPMPI